MSEIGIVNVSVIAIVEDDDAAEAENGIGIGIVPAVGMTIGTDISMIDTGDPSRQDEGAAEAGAMTTIAIATTVTVEAVAHSIPILESRPSRT